MHTHLAELKWRWKALKNFSIFQLITLFKLIWKAFRKSSDAVGGINVNNTLDFKVGDDTFPKGEISLNGEEALAFVRMRYGDPRGEFGRQDRQKQVIQAVLRKGASVSSLLNYKSIFSAIGNNVRTNMTFDEMVDVQANYRDSTKRSNSYTLKKVTEKV